MAYHYPGSSPPVLSLFQPTTLTEFRYISCSSPEKQYALFVFPTALQDIEFNSGFRRYF